MSVEIKRAKLRTSNEIENTIGSLYDRYLHNMIKNELSEDAVKNRAKIISDILRYSIWVEKNVINVPRD